MKYHYIIFSIFIGLIQSFPFESHHLKEAIYTCDSPITRLKAGPIEPYLQNIYIWLGEHLPAFLQFHYIDVSASRRDASYWFGLSSFQAIWDTEFDIFTW